MAINPNLAGNIPKQSASNMNNPPKRGRRPRKGVVQRANDNRRNRDRNKQPNKPNQQGGNQQGGKMFGAIGGYGGVSRKQARQLVNSTIMPEIRKLRDERGTINTMAGDAIEDTNTLYGRSVGDLNHIFGAADQYNTQMGNTINTNYTNANQQLGQIGAGTTQQMQAQTSAAQQAIQSELARLGIGGNMGVDPTLQQDAAFAQGQVSQQTGNNQANMAASQQAASTVTSLLGGMIQGSKASNLGRVLNTRNDDISDINRTKRDDLSSVMQGIQELKKSRPTMIRDMLMQLQAQGFDQWQALQALNMDRKSLNHSMNMDRAGMIQDSAYAGTSAAAYQAQAGHDPYGQPSTGNSNMNTNGNPYSSPVGRGPRGRKPRGRNPRDPFLGPVSNP